MHWVTVGRIYPGREERGISKKERNIYKNADVREINGPFWRTEQLHLSIGCVCGNGRKWGLEAGRQRAEMALCGLIGCSYFLLKIMGYRRTLRWPQCVEKNYVFSGEKSKLPLEQILQPWNLDCGNQTSREESRVQVSGLKVQMTGDAIH